MNQTVVTPFWLSVFLDLPAPSFEAATGFWSAVTGWPDSARRGEHAEFGTLVPPDGDPYLKVQRLAAGGPRLHLDLHVPDPRAAADAAVSLGATELADQGYVVLRSPGGITFCYVTLVGSRVPGPTQWPDGSASRMDQVCLDLPAEVHDTERDFWSALLGAPVAEPFPRTEFSRLTPPWSPLRVLVQRLEEPDGPARAHLDLAVTDRAALTARHRERGAGLIREDTWWTVLADPAGAEYCLTDREPD